MSASDDARNWAKLAAGRGEPAPDLDAQPEPDETNAWTQDDQERELRAGFQRQHGRPPSPNELFDLLAHETP